MFPACGCLPLLFGLRCRRPAAVCGTSRWCARVLWLCSRPACLASCRFCADFCARCPVCPPCAFLHTFLPCFGCPVCPSCAVCAGFSLIFHPFLPNFFLSKLFSLVAQAVMGLSFFICARSVVFRPAGRLLLLCKLLRPLPCLPAVRFIARIFILFRLSVRPFCAMCAGLFSFVFSLFPA